MCRGSQAASQGLGGGWGHQVPLRFRCVRRRVKTLALFPRVMLRGAGFAKAAETVNASLRSRASGLRRRTPRRRRWIVRTHTARGGPARGSHHRAPKGDACDGGRPLAAGLRPSRQRENGLGAGGRAAPHRMPRVRAWVGWRRRGPLPCRPARGQKTSSFGPARGENATGPPTRCLA